MRLRKYWCNPLTTASKETTYGGLKTSCRRWRSDIAVRRCCSFDGHRSSSRCGAVARNHDRTAGPFTAVVKRYGGTLSQFTGDGIMAVFGAPITLEDHAVRACRAALGIQEEAKRLAAGVQDRDGIDLWLRVGLNSGRVIAGEIGSGALGYTAIGEQVGMAQRMESVAPPGAVMLSASTARLVDGSAALGEAEMVRSRVPTSRWPPTACWASATGSAASGMLSRTGRSAVENVRRWGPSAARRRRPRRCGRRGGVTGYWQEPSGARDRRDSSRSGVDVFTAYCESHTIQVRREHRLLT